MKKKVLRICLCIFCLLFIYILIRQRKVYYFTHVDNSENSKFSSEQLDELSDKDAILNLSFTNVMLKRPNSVVFTVFSKSNFKELKIKDFEIHYDGKVKKIIRKNIYQSDDTNENLVKLKEYTVNGSNYTGVEKLFFPDFNTKNFCWINFYDLFKWKHGKLNDTFPVKVSCHYFLDDEEYFEEQNYQVKCEKSYPDRLYKALLCIE